MKHTKVTMKDILNYMNLNKKANWNLPFLFKDFKYISILNYNGFHENITFYGSPEFKWNAGRKGEENLDIEIIHKYINMLNSLNVKCFATFSNYNLIEKDLYDSYGNEILSVLNINNTNGVIISSDILFDHINKNYPNIKIKCSILKSVYENFENDSCLYDIMCKKFDYVVTSPNVTIETLKKIKEKNKLEIIINENCVYNCRYRKECYNKGRNLNCKYGIGNNKTTELSEKEVNLILSLGIKELKLQGRGHF